MKFQPLLATALIVFAFAVILAPVAIKEMTRPDRKPTAVYSDIIQPRLEGPSDGLNSELMARIKELERRLGEPPQIAPMPYADGSFVAPPACCSPGK